MTNQAVKEWEEYRDKVYDGETLGPNQERECSLAFYAGMMCAFMTVATISDSVPDSDDGLNHGADLMEKFRIDIDRAAARANLDRNTGKS
jgi:hypothetical protein